MRVECPILYLHRCRFSLEIMEDNSKFLFTITSLGQIWVKTKLFGEGINFQFCTTVFHTKTIEEMKLFTIMKNEKKFEVHIVCCGIRSH